MAIIETWFNQDLKKAVNVQYIDGNVFSQDNNGNRVGVNVYDNGSAASLSGSVAANVIRSDGATVAVSGTLSGNQAYVDLPQAAYAVPGVISIVIKLTSDSDITTLCAVVANVYQSSTDSAVDPGTIIPSIETLIAEIEAAVASIPADYSSLWTRLAPSFSSSKNYVAGQYVTYDGGVYRFKVDHSGNWSASDVVSVDLGLQITNTNKALSPYNPCNVIDLLFNASSASSHDVTFTWQGRTCSVSGTASATVTSQIFTSCALPDGIIPGETYQLLYETTNPNIQLGLVWFDSNNDYSYGYYTESQWITIPTTAVKWSVRLYVASGANATGTVSLIGLMSKPTNEEILKQCNNANLLLDYLATLKLNPTTVDDGITFKKENDGTFSISGDVIATRAIFFDLFYSRTSFPDGMSAGSKYWIVGKSNTFNIRVITYTSPSDSGTQQFSGKGDFVGQMFEIPSNATGVTIRLQKTDAMAEQTYSETGIRVSVYNADNYHMNALGLIASGSNGNENAHIWCIGNSFMNGAVWHNNSYDHLVGYADSIYGQVSVALGISPSNCNHVMHSSTGLLAEGADGCFLDIITETDITPYDFIMTQFNGTDIDTYNLGTVNSTDNDGTLAGAVVHLLNYMETQNGICKLILLGTPPYSATPSRSGQYVFTGNWSKGYSINDLDNVMYALA